MWLNCFAFANCVSSIRLLIAFILGFAVCAVRKKDNQKKIQQMFPDDDIRETIINYADGAGEENTVYNQQTITACPKMQRFLFRFARLLFYLHFPS